MAKGGGAWKVAYADFVTAMMALFMVLWIMSQDTEILVATSRYFQQPFNSPLERSSGLLGDGDESIINEKQDLALTTNMLDLSMLHELQHEFYRMLDLEESDEAVQVAVTDDGLRVTVFDDIQEPLFKGQTTEFTDWGELMIRNMAWMVESYGLNIRIDAHCPTGHQFEDAEYDAFNLTTDRANAVRRALVYYALPERRMQMVIGHADRAPLFPEDPTNPRNQRIELSLSFETD